MREQTGHPAGAATGRRASGPTVTKTEKGERRELLLLKAGTRLLCVSAQEAHSAVAWREPTPLPRSPQALLGVVSIRGRMFTLLDSLALLGEQTGQAEQAPLAHPSYAFIIPLRGDEQLALASDQAPRIIEIDADEIESSSRRETGSKAVRAIVRGEQQEQVALLDIQEIFNAAMQGVERRRRRF